MATSMSERNLLTRSVIRERGEEAIRRYVAGESTPRIAADFGIRPQAVLNHLRRNGVPIRPKGGTGGVLDEVDLRRACEMYADGASLKAVADEVGICHTSVRRELARAGVEIRRAGGFYSKPLLGPENPSWRGGRHTNREGYVLTWLAVNDPFAAMRNRKGYVMEHRLVMARHLNRPLLSTETVHHINGDRSDNRIENLQLRARAHGPGTRLRCLDCGSENVESVEL